MMACPRYGPIGPFERTSWITDKPPGPLDITIVPLSVLPFGFHSLGSFLMIADHVPTTLSTFAISGAGFAFSMLCDADLPDLPAGSFSGVLFCATANAHMMMIT